MHIIKSFQNFKAKVCKNIYSISKIIIIHFVCFLVLQYLFLSYINAEINTSKLKCLTNNTEKTEIKSTQTIFLNSKEKNLFKPSCNINKNYASRWALINAKQSANIDFIFNNQQFLKPKKFLLILKVDPRFMGNTATFLFEELQGKNDNNNEDNTNDITSDNNQSNSTILIPWFSPDFHKRNTLNTYNTKLEVSEIKKLNEFLLNDTYENDPEKIILDKEIRSIYSKMFLLNNNQLKIAKNSIIDARIITNPEEIREIFNKISYDTNIKFNNFNASLDINNIFKLNLYSKMFDKFNFANKILNIQVNSTIEQYFDVNENSYLSRIMGDCSIKDGKDDELIQKIKECKSKTDLFSDSLCFFGIDRIVFDKYTGLNNNIIKDKEIDMQFKTLLDEQLHEQIENAEKTGPDSDAINISQETEIESIRGQYITDQDMYLGISLKNFDISANSFIAINYPIFLDLNAKLSFFDPVKSEAKDNKDKIKYIQTGFFVIELLINDINLSNINNPKLNQNFLLEVATIPKNNENAINPNECNSQFSIEKYEINPNSIPVGQKTLPNKAYNGLNDMYIRVLSDEKINLQVNYTYDDSGKFAEIINKLSSAILGSYRKAIGTITKDLIEKLRDVMLFVLIIYIMITGARILIGDGSVSIKDFIIKISKITLVIAVFEYQVNLTEIFDTIITLLKEGLNIGQNNQKSLNIFNFVDEFIKNLLNPLLLTKILLIPISAIIIPVAGFLNLLKYLLIIPMIFTSMFSFTKSMFNIIFEVFIAYLFISILIILTPIFILFSFLTSTQIYFANWVKQIISFVAKPGFCLLLFIIMQELIFATLDKILPNICYIDFGTLLYDFFVNDDTSFTVKGIFKALKMILNFEVPMVFMHSATYMLIGTIIFLSYVNISKQISSNIDRLLK